MSSQLSICALQHCVRSVSCGIPRRIKPCWPWFVHWWLAKLITAGVSVHLLGRLHSVLNAAAGLIFSSSRLEHISPLLCGLHWLRVPQRIQFQLRVLTFRCLYLADSLRCAASVDGRHHLSSANTMLLIVPSTLLLNTWRPCLSHSCGPSVVLSSINDQSLSIAVDILTTSQNFSL